MAPENIGQIQKRGRFLKGQSGNPRGKPYHDPINF